MMGVYIKGMEMPKNGWKMIVIKSNGDVVAKQERIGDLLITGQNEQLGEAVPVPPHGRLIDKDELIHDIKGADSWENAIRAISRAPTIIPAEEE